MRQNRRTHCDPRSVWASASTLATTHCSKEDGHTSTIIGQRGTNYKVAVQFSPAWGWKVHLLSPRSWMQQQLSHRLERETCSVHTLVGKQFQRHSGKNTSSNTIYNMKKTPNNSLGNVNPAYSSRLGFGSASCCCDNWIFPSILTDRDDGHAAAQRLLVAIIATKASDPWQHKLFRVFSTSVTQN